MFRIKNNNSTDVYSKQSPARKLLAKLRANKKAQVAVFGILAIMAGYLIWTHGNPFGWRDDEILAAQLNSPLPPEWQQRFFGRQICRRDSYCGPQADPDRDNLTNYEEFLYFTDPTNPDTDSDGYLDGEEVRTLSNPLGEFTSDLVPRNLNSIYEYNPVLDEFLQEGLEGVQEGTVTTIDQIGTAASRLTQLPEFKEIPFSITDNNTQAGVDQYADSFAKLVTDYKDKPISNLTSSIADTTDIDQLNEYIEATQIFASSFVFIEVPSDLFNFHRAYYGSITFNSLIADTQRQYLQGNLTQSQAKDQMRTYTIYYTRFIQDANAYIQKIKEKYNFPIELSE